VPDLPLRSTSRRIRRLVVAVALSASLAIALSACGTAGSTASVTSFSRWSAVEKAATGQTVHLWMYGGDPQGNAYVDRILSPAVAKYGVTLKRVPIADTKDALNRVLSELQAGHTTNGAVDLVWINGDNFLTGKQAGAWLCHWTSLLPNMAKTSAADPLLSNDFGTPVDGCEAPWSKAQLSFVYNSAAMPNPPTSVAGILAWAHANPGRFTYPAPPDFTGSAFIREVLYSTAGGYANVPARYSTRAFSAVTPTLYRTLAELTPVLWHRGDTYPANSDQLDTLYSTHQVDMTMTYGPATLTKLVADGTYPADTKVMSLHEGTIGNASFLGIPVNAASRAGAMVVANVALSVSQQVAKANPSTWGQFTVLSLDALSANERAQFAALPQSPVVPPFGVLSRNANPELSAAWVPPLDDGWRAHVPTGQ
jgi:putative spermidine/putrescine transport system substrate-binding protein